MKIYIVISRDNGMIGAFKDKQSAEKIKTEQYTFEEMGGGRPSVFIQETKLT
jgi:hypothetical protein